MSDFRWLNKQGVEHASGFIVQFTGRFTAEYRDGGHTLIVDIESGQSAGKPAICYSQASFNTWPGSPADRARASSNFAEAIRFQGLIPVAG